MFWQNILSPNLMHSCRVQKSPYCSDSNRETIHWV